jgi:hypothetical protein
VSLVADAGAAESLRRFTLAAPPQAKRRRAYLQPEPKSWVRVCRRNEERECVKAIELGTKQEHSDKHVQNQLLEALLVVSRWGTNQDGGRVGRRSDRCSDPQGANSNRGAPQKTAVRAVVDATPRMPPTESILPRQSWRAVSTDTRVPCRSPRSQHHRSRRKTSSDECAHMWHPRRLAINPQMQPPRSSTYHRSYVGRAATARELQRGATRQLQRSPPSHAIEGSRRRGSRTWICARD